MMQNTLYKKFTITLLSSMVGLAMAQSAFANDKPLAVLQGMSVVTDINKATQANQTTVSSQDIQDQHINTQQDLVRYNPEVTVAKIGRYGSTGFAMRGVDSNRVAMTYDGVSLPEQQINSAYSRYGYMYEGRVTPDSEMLSSAQITKGSDSVNVGSGAMGGSVNYQSKEPIDLLKGNNTIGGYVKVGHTNKNEETMQAVGLAGVQGKFSAIVNYAHRDGHELKNHQMVGANNDKLKADYDFANDADYNKPSSSNASILPDPIHYTSHSAMGKVYYEPTDEHRFGIKAGYENRSNSSHDYSYARFAPTDERISDDQTQLNSLGVNYRYRPVNNNIIDTVTARVTKQDVDAVADTDIYRNNEYIRYEYRPQYDQNTKLSLTGNSRPITTGLGTHQLSLATDYERNDHQLILKAWNKTRNPKVVTDTFVGPSVKKDNYSFSLKDTITVNDKFNAQLGLRYDNHTFNPYMSDKDSKALDNKPADDLARKLYKEGKFDTSENISNVSWLAGANYTITPDWQIGYKASTGFTAPSIAQKYSVYEAKRYGPVIQQLMNPDLKPETSLNHELSVTGKVNTFNVNASAFHTDYKNFIESASGTKVTGCTTTDGKQVSLKDCPADGTKNMVMYSRSENVNKAETSGVRIGGDVDISQLINKQGSLQLSSAVSYAKSRNSKGENLLATQPLTGIFGVDYSSAKDDYQLHGKVRYLGAKKADEAQIEQPDPSKPAGRGQPPAPLIIAPYKYADKSKSAFVFDVYGSKKLDNGLKLSAGVYNVFDKKYITWDNLRSLDTANVNSSMDSEERGMERYTAPGRNFAVSLSYEH